MAASSIRFGPGVTREVGMDLSNMGVRKVAVVTDKTVDQLQAMRAVREALDSQPGIEYKVFNQVKIEPKDYSHVPPLFSPPSLTNPLPASKKPSPGPSPTTPTPSSPSAAAP